MFHLVVSWNGFWSGLWGFFVLIWDCWQYFIASWTCLLVFCNEVLLKFWRTDFLCNSNVFSCKRMYSRYSVSKWLSTVQEQASYRLLCVILELISERRVAVLLSVDRIFSFFIFLLRLKVSRLMTLFIQTKSYSSLFCQ